MCQIRPAQALCHVIIAQRSYRSVPSGAVFWTYIHSSRRTAKSIIGSRSVFRMYAEARILQQLAAGVIMCWTSVARSVKIQFNRMKVVVRGSCGLAHFLSTHESEIGPKATLRFGRWPRGVGRPSAPAVFSPDWFAVGRGAFVGTHPSMLPLFLALFPSSHSFPPSRSTPGATADTVYILPTYQHHLHLTNPLFFKQPPVAHTIPNNGSHRRHTTPRRRPRRRR